MDALVSLGAGRELCEFGDDSPEKHAGFEIAEKEALCQLGVVIDFHSCRLFVVVIFDTADDGRNVHVGHTLTARPRKDQFAIILRVHEEIFG